MDDITVIKIVFGIGLSIGAIVLLLIAFLVYYKYLIIDKKCNEKTTGVVKRYTLASRGVVHLPVVYYTVNDKEYKVVGPQYRGYKVIATSSPLSENKVIECREDENGYLVIKKTNNSLLNITKNPMATLYPIGTLLDVYYCDTNPKISYVVRNPGKNKWMFWLFFITAICLLVLDFFIIVILK